MTNIGPILLMLCGNGGAEPRLMDLRRQTQHQADAQRLAGGVGGRKRIGIALIKGYEEELSLLLGIKGAVSTSNPPCSSPYGGLWGTLALSPTPPVASGR